MNRSLKFTLLGVSVLALVYLVPLGWCAFGRHGYFIGNTYWGIVYHSYWYFKGDQLYEFWPGEGDWGF